MFSFEAQKKTIMKKRLFTLFGMIALSGAAFSQTWSFSNEPTVGTSTIMYLVDTTSSNYSTLTGANQTWNYSTLAGYEDNSRIVSVEDASESEVFPNASLLLNIPGFMQTFYEYAEGTNDKMAHGYVFEVPGFGEARITFSDLAKMLEFPTATGTSFTDAVSGILTIMDEDNTIEGNTWVSVDGTGTLQLANGVSHTNVMRIYTLDTLYSEITLSGLPIPVNVTIVRQTYDYVKPGASNFPLFTHSTLLVLSPLGTIKIGVVLSTENPTTFVNIENETQNNLVVYPNPTNGLFTVNTGNLEASSVSVVDITGRVVFESNVASSQIHVDLTQELAGIYFVNIVRAGITTVEKVIIK
jgi:hypothetical protein